MNKDIFVKRYRHFPSFQMLSYMLYGRKGEINREKTIFPDYFCLCGVFLRNILINSFTFDLSYSL